MRKLLQAILLISLTALLLMACVPVISQRVVTTSTSPVIQQQTVRREAQVQSVEVQVANSAPLQVNAVVRGVLTESCATLGESQVQYTPNAFQITVYVDNRAEIGCAQVTTPFETSIPLEVEDLPAGSYTVIANGASTGFTLPEADPANGTINGWVWHDLCASDSLDPGANCVQTDKFYRGDGLIENDESPIPGVKVTLGLGTCPSTGLKETTTIVTDLSYSFTGLEAGTYCVSIDPQDETNAGILSSGTWTYPSVTKGTVRSTVTLEAGENRFDVNFGWDYEFLPAVSQTCSDSAAFIKDVTIPDNSVLASNAAFTKTWRLRNTGTCTWDSTYLVAYISGATMSQQPGYWIVSQGQTVAPGQTVDVSVGMTSPVENGSYASYWGLKKLDGQFMPIQGGANGDSFFVKIKVGNGIPPGNVTSASIAIEPEEGSGAACTGDSTYFVHASITTNGATTVTYEIDSTAGQTPAGYFQASTGDPSLSIPGTLVFDQADTKTINLRFVGPYPYPDNITMLLWINRSDWYQAKLPCS